DTSKVLILSKVKLLNLQNNKEVSYTIVPENEANFKLGKISISSPIAKGLLGKSVDETVEIKVPAGIMKYKILEISR
ncbi:MAG: GreA/GreB family elongation factor, partial [Bacteroidales bacterium]|nr:GreA/GreB family elongation factor [Bacteroidales bacterium]